VSAFTADKVQDSIGQPCPMPIVGMAKNLRGMAAGQVLEVHADDPGAKADVPAWCRQTGNEFLAEEDAGSFQKYWVRKKA
jgi:tRNA 2-thiouridine synthesizing protein A